MAARDELRGEPYGRATLKWLNQKSKIEKEDTKIIPRRARWQDNREGDDLDFMEGVLRCSLNKSHFDLFCVILGYDNGSGRRRSI